MAIVSVLNTEKDQFNNIIAEIHDESHWNRYLIDHPPAVILPRGFLSPESGPWAAGDRKITHVDKDHEKIRAC